MSAALVRRLKNSPQNPRKLGELLDVFAQDALAAGRYRNPNQLAARLRALAPLDRTLRTLKAAHIVRFFADFERGPAKHGGPRSPETVELHAGVLKAALKWGVEQGYLAASPMPPRIRLIVSREARDPLERDQNRLTSEDAGRILTDSRIPAMRRAIYRLALFAGPRPGELIEMRLGDIKTDNEGGRYWLLSRQYQANEQDCRQTKTRINRAVALHPELDAAINEHITHWWPRRFGRTPEAADLVFPSAKFNDCRRINTSTLSRWLKKDLALVGGRPRSFHTLRSTFISRLIVELEQPALLVEWVTHRTSSAANGGPVVGGYTRGVYEKTKAMLHSLHYPAVNAAQLDFGFTL